MPDKDIMEMAILPTPNTATWMEVVDTDETDPALQNKRMLVGNVIPTNDHVQNTDIALDEGGANEVTAAAIAPYVNRPHAFAWAWLGADPTSVGTMNITVGGGDSRVVAVNTTALGSMLVVNIINGLTTGDIVTFTFPDGHLIGMLQNPPNIAANVASFTVNMLSESGTYSGYGFLTITKA